MNNATRAFTRPLTVPSGILDGSASPQRIQEPGQALSHVLTSSVVGWEEPDLGLIATSGPKNLLQGVKESPGSFPLLKSVADGLCFILDHCEVWFQIPHLICNAYGFSSKQR